MERNTYMIKTTLKKYDKYNNRTFKARDAWAARNTIRHMLKLSQYDAKRYFNKNKIRVVML